MGDKMLYTLMNKNQYVLDFEYDDEIHVITHVNKIYQRGEYAPIGTMNYMRKITRQLLNNWWKSRSIPASRQGIEKIKDHYKIDGFDELIMKSFGASLSDQYWVKPVNSQLTWKDINFFENDFSEDLGEALLGNKMSDSLLEAQTPDATSDGNLRKRWKIIDGKRFLIKGGNDIFNQEPFNEVIATKLYQRILDKDDFVEYELFEDHGQYYSKCPNFIQKNEELVPAIHIDMIMKSKANDSLYNRYLKCCYQLQLPNVKQAIDKMIVCDYIIGNYDRHYRNFGAIRNVETLQWTRIAPIFDSGSSLWANSANIDIGKDYNAKPFKKSAEQQLNLVEDLSWLEVSKLDGFVQELKDTLSLNPKIDNDRINRIASAVESRIMKIIQISKKKM